MEDLIVKLKKYEKIGILGLGITGESAYNFFNKNNIPIVVWDDSQKARDKFAYNHSAAQILNYESGWENCSHIIVSPGIPLYSSSHKILKIAAENNIILTSDIEILFDVASDNAKFLAVTGTNGKSTTISLIGHFLKLLGKNCAVGGNIGKCSLDLPLNSDIYVLELSSYQLELLDKFKADIAILLNITPDHLDRHKTMDNYIKAKINIFNNQTENDYAIIVIDSPVTAWIYEEVKHNHENITIGISNNHSATKNIICYDKDGIIIDNFWRSSIALGNNIYLQGKHNHENLTAAYAACKALGVNESFIEQHIDTFIGLPHRMQYVGRIGKISFYNDSKATNAESVRPALIALENIFWIAGGVAKEGGIEILLNSMDNVKKVYLFGEAGNEFAFLLKDKKPIEVFLNLDSAFKKAYIDALESDEAANIVLSPACASYDQYNNFEERGEHFINLYKDLDKVADGN